MSEFEKWWNANVTYTDAKVRLPGAIDIWNAALEAAAKVCDDVARVYIDASNRGTAEPLLREAAAGILALKHTPEQSNG